MPETEFTSNFPVWYQLMMLLRADILSGDLPPGARIDAEVRLAETHGVSVMPVRRALRSLEAEGLIERHRGRGTFVVHRPVPPPGTTSLEALYSREFGREPLLLERGSAAVPACFSAMFGDQRELGFVRRLAYQDDVPWSYGLLYFLPEFDERITSERLLRFPLYRVMEEQCGIRLQRSKFAVRAVPAPPAVARQLAVDPFYPLLHITAVSYDFTGRAVGAFDMHFVSEAQVFTFETLHPQTHNPKR